MSEPTRPLALLQLELAELERQEQRTVDAIGLCRAHNITWQAIADVMGHNNRSAAKRWHDRRTNNA